jgi:hypothetical protein
MSYPYTMLHVEAQRAKQRLVQAFHSAPYPCSESPPSPITKNYPLTNEQIDAAARLCFFQELKRSPEAFPDRTSKGAAPTRSGWADSDMSPFSFGLALLLLCTVAAAHTNHPVLWLLLGPAPFAVGLTALTFLRKRFGQLWPPRFFGRRDRCYNLSRPRCPLDTGSA